MNELEQTHWRVWLVILLLTLLAHALVFKAPVQWIGPSAPPKIEIQPVDPAKLREIREQWKKKDAEKLLINPDKTKAKDDVEAPKDARYFSDRNTRVEKEQRARDHVVTPRPGQPAPPQAESKGKSAPLPSLGNLGVPLRLDAKPYRPRTESAAPQGGSQYIDEKNLPIGSENLLNTRESVFYSFYSRLYESIGPLWQSRLHDIAPNVRVAQGEYTTLVDVVMDRSGKLLEVRLVQSSGIRPFDDAVTYAWRKIADFPNPPTGLLDKNGEIHTGWSFTVNVGNQSGIQFLPPERAY